MTNKTIKIDLMPKRSDYRVVIGHDLIPDAGSWARKCLGKAAARVVIVSNKKVFALFGKQTEESLLSAGFAVTHILIGDGEQHKDLRSAESVLKCFAASGLDRTDGAIALGGGVVGDVAGFASAIYLRGLSFLQIPTTLLAMIDSSVGGKTGVNTRFGKNLTGAFHQPLGVLVDTSPLRTLPQRELTAGFCEAVKQGAIGSRGLLAQTAALLNDFPIAEQSGSSSDKVFQAQIADLIAAHIAYKAKIVAGDEREALRRTDHRSRKILNFGHTLAHALEKVTDYKYLRHGEAVGYGILFAAELSKSLALCAEKDVKLLNDVLHRVGPLPRLADIDAKEVFEAFRSDKKHLSGSLQMVLLKGIGKPLIMDTRLINRSTMQKVLKQLLQKWA